MCVCVCVHALICMYMCAFVCTFVCPSSVELWKQKLRSCLLRIQSSKKNFPLKPAVSQNIAMHTTHTARDFFFANFYPPSPFTCIFSKTFPRFLLR